MNSFLHRSLGAMRLLFLSLTFPVPANNGHKMRTWALLRALASAGHETTLLTFADPHEADGNYSLLREVCSEIEVVPLTLTNLSAANDYIGRLKGLFSALPYGAQRFLSPGMQEQIGKELARESFDAVICDTIFSLVNLPPGPLPLILNNVDVEHMILQRYLAFETNPAKQLYAWLESRKVRDWERRACRRATVGMACSEHDRIHLQVLSPGLRIMVVPNVVDTGSYLPVGEENQSTLLYQGGMDWYPNQDAVEFFVSAILPELRKLVAGVKFIVAGRNPPEKFRHRFAGIPEVEFTGTVPDIRAEIARAAVCVVPLRIGSGTRMKILEAGAMAKPIVSTRVGAEGLEFVDGEDIVLADDPRTFAWAVAVLLTDVPRRRALGQAARRRVEQHYSFPVLRTAIRTVLAQLGTIARTDACEAGLPRLEEKVHP